MHSRDAILERVLDHLPIDQTSKRDVTDDAILADFGVASLHLITLLLTLQREFNLEGSALVDADMPMTVGELVSLIQNNQGSA